MATETKGWETTSAARTAAFTTRATKTAGQICAIMSAVDRDALDAHFRQDEGDDDEREPVVVCDGVSIDAFNAYVGDGEGLAIGLRFLELSQDGQILVVDLPSRVHEATSREFNDAFLQALGNSRAISKGGSMTAHRPGNPHKEADETYGPLPCTPNRGPPPRNRALRDWVTLIVEVGRSQTWSSLENAACWWYGYAGVEYVLLLKVSPSGRRLDYRLYDVRNNPLRRNGALPNPFSSGEVREGAGPPQNVVFETRRILGIPRGQVLPPRADGRTPMPDHITVNMRTVRNAVVEAFRDP